MLPKRPFTRHCCCKVVYVVLYIIRNISYRPSFILYYKLDIRCAHSKFVCVQDEGKEGLSRSLSLALSVSHKRTHTHAHTHSRALSRSPSVTCSCVPSLALFLSLSPARAFSLAFSLSQLHLYAHLQTCALTHAHTHCLSRAMARVRPLCVLRALYVSLSYIHTTSLVPRKKETSSVAGLVAHEHALSLSRFLACSLSISELKGLLQEVNTRATQTNLK